MGSLMGSLQASQRHARKPRNRRFAFPTRRAPGAAMLAQLPQRGKVRSTRLPGDLRTGALCRGYILGSEWGLRG